jgi:hypothetical protein
MKGFSRVINRTNHDTELCSIQSENLHSATFHYQASELQIRTADDDKEEPALEGVLEQLKNKKTNSPNFFFLFQRLASSFKTQLLYSTVLYGMAQSPIRKTLD